MKGKWLGDSDTNFKKIVSYHLYRFFLKTITNDWSEWLAVTVYKINVVHYKMAMSKKDDRQRSRFFIASKGVDLSSDIWPSRSLKGSLHNINWC